ncbi:WD repeat-containing protein 89 [Frankliniella fusca]|uniref:WD repeat-containing protein 89 n=1 Tax=Frankliniella fusca TaxID=407009 RepID=A0AAE1I076_9NEOP|nr:WD repeat-containing protein 89 [Frankliniella fusca]
MKNLESIKQKIEEVEISQSDDDSDSEDSGSDSSESGESSSADSDINVDLKVSYHLSQEKAVSMQKIYICHMCGSASTNQVATAFSDLTSSLYDINGLQHIRTFEGHQKTITNIRFNPSDPHQIVSSSTDGTVRFWDIRKAGKSALIFKDDTAESKQLKPFLSFDISKSGHFLCAGTELFDGDAFLVFGDARSGKILGGYWESHSDDITQVAFHPNLSDSVASGSADGLINIYNLKSDNEDDALISSLNTESTIDKLAWYQIEGAHKGLSCILDTMEIQLWEDDGVSPYSTFSRKHISKSTSWKVDESYVVNVHQAASGDLYVLTGASTKNSEDLAFLHIKDKTLLVETALPGNKQRVRCSWYNSENGSLITAGEGGILSVWKSGTEKGHDNSGKILSKTSVRSKPY